MINKHHQYPVASILLSMLVFLLPISKALASIVTAFLMAYVAYVFFKLKPRSINKVLIFSFIAYFGLAVLSLIYSENLAVGLQKVMLKIPLLFVPLLAYALEKEYKKWEINFELIFICVFAVIGLLSSANYFSNKADLDFLVLQNKPIPVLCDIYHIEFSVILATAVLISVYRISFFRWIGSLYQYLFLLAGLASAFSLHIMSVRTGLLSLYVGLSVLLLLFIIETKKYWILAVGILASTLTLFLVYKTSESFKNRVALTLDDINVLQTNRDRNWHSVSMRVDAFKNGIYILKEHPILGVGIGDVDTAVQLSFIKHKSKLQYVNRKKPHHQFLENGIQSGIFSPALLLIILLLPFIYKSHRNPMLICFVSMFFVAMQFESLLERQATLVIFCLLYAHFWAMNKRMIF